MRRCSSPRSLLRTFVLAVLLGQAAALAPGPPELRAGTGPQPTEWVATETAPGVPDPRTRSGFPEPLGWTWPLIAVFGALGAFTGELVAGAGLLDGSGPRRGRAGLAMSLAGRLVVGAAAALFVLSLHPPNGSWFRLAGTALGSGVGGEAVLLGLLASRRAQSAVTELEAAQAQAALGATLAIEKIETFRALSLAARRGAAPEQDPAPSLPEDAAELGGGPAELAGFDRIINTYAERAKAEIAAAG
jgi:hypothetical protein